jgi:predicted RNA-binding Zn-ribbon protein involved in translation (DUF1610 family)
MINSAPLTPRFNCPKCGTLYTIVPVEPDGTSDDREVSCTSCSAPLPARDGGLVRKYFLLRRIGTAERARYTVL